MPTELKPCPFCGGEAILCKESKFDIYAEIEIALVKCDCCGANTGTYYTNGVYGTTTTVQDAINAWNRRNRKKTRCPIKGISYIPYLNKEKTNDQI